MKGDLSLKLSDPNQVHVRVHLQSACPCLSVFAEPGSRICAALRGNGLSQRSDRTPSCFHTKSIKISGVKELLLHGPDSVCKARHLSSSLRPTPTSTRTASIKSRSLGTRIRREAFRQGLRFFSPYRGLAS